MTHENQPIGAYLAAGAISGAVCVAEHVVMWPRRADWHELARYAAGVGAIWAGFEIGLQTGASPRKAFVAAVAGSAVATSAAHLFRYIEGKKRIEHVLDEVRRGL